jgi:hypothetical protein
MEPDHHQLVHQRLSAACAAYRINNQEILQWDQDPAQANVNLAEDLLAGNGEHQILDEDRAQADEILKYFSQHIMTSVLSNRRIGGFVMHLDEIFTGKVTQAKMRSLVWAPRCYAKMQHYSEQREQVSYYAARSKRFANVSDVIYTQFTQLRTTWVPEYAFYVVLGHTEDDNLVSFTVAKANKNVDAKLAKTFKMRARAKWAGYDRRLNGYLTQLSYVKVLNEKE